MLTHNTHYATSSGTRPFCSPFLSVNVAFNSAASTKVCAYFRLQSDFRSAESVVFCYHGLYWFSMRTKDFKPINSIGFLSLKNCIHSAKFTFVSLRYSYKRIPLDSVELLTFDKILSIKILNGDQDEKAKLWGIR